MNKMHWSDDDPFWDTMYALENLLDYWEADIDHAFVSYGHWANEIDF